MLKADRLTKRYGSLVAVEAMSFEVAPGEVLGFLGPNGAGKTTTMRMIAGFITPTAGTASLCGHDVGTDSLAARRCLGYLPEGAPGYGEMTPRAFLDFIADLRVLKGTHRTARLEYVIERLALGPVLDQSIDTLSKGYRRRVGLAQAIVHDPPVLILDEPTDGLDPNQKHEVRTLIDEMARDKLVVISTHALEEVDAVCTRAIVIAHGRLVADDTPAGLAARSRYHNAVCIRVADPEQRGVAREAAASLAEVQSVEEAPGGDLTAFPHPGRPILEALRGLLSERGIALHELHLESGRLDEVFRAITTSSGAAR